MCLLFRERGKIYLMSLWRERERREGEREGEEERKRRHEGKRWRRESKIS